MRLQMYLQGGPIDESFGAVGTTVSSRQVYFEVFLQQGARFEQFLANFALVFLLSAFQVSSRVHVDLGHVVELLRTHSTGELDSCQNADLVRCDRGRWYLYRLLGDVVSQAVFATVFVDVCLIRLLISKRNGARVASMNLEFWRLNFCSFQKIFRQVFLFALVYASYVFLHVFFPSKYFHAQMTFVRKQGMSISV